MQVLGSAPVSKANPTTAVVEDGGLRVPTEGSNPEDSSIPKEGHVAFIPANAEIFHNIEHVVNEHTASSSDNLHLDVGMGIAAARTSINVKILSSIRKRVRVTASTERR